MRLTFAVTLLYLTACSSNPAPVDAGDGLPHDGCGIVDNACYVSIDVPVDRGTPPDVGFDARPVDMGEDASYCDTGPCRCPDGRSGNYVCGSEWCVCTGPVDAGMDVQMNDAAPVSHDGCGLDPDGNCVGPMDVQPDRGAPVDATCSPDAPVPCPCGLTSGARECRADGTLGLCQCGVGTDAGSDVPSDVRINCAPIGKPDITCRSHADCTACIPGAFNSIWCCARSGVCANTSNPTCE